MSLGHALLLPLSSHPIEGIPRVFPPREILIRRQIPIDSLAPPATKTATAKNGRRHKEISTVWVNTVSNQPLVSLIIPTYNAENFIAECLESIFKQTYKNIEVIVVDDGSKDKTAEIIKEYRDRIHYFYQNSSGGPASPRNVGIAHSHGEYLCFFDSDDLMAPDYIMRQVDFLQRHADVGMVFCDYRNFDSGQFYEKSHFQTCPELWSIIGTKTEMILQHPCRLLAKENFGIMGTLTIRRSTLQYQSSFNESLTSSVDFDFYYKLARFSPLGIHNYEGQLRRLHKNNITSNQIKALNMSIYCYNLLVETEQDNKAKTLLKKHISICWTDLARYYANSHDYIQSFRSELHSLSSNFCFSQLLRSLKGFTRTACIATGLHSPQGEIYQAN